MSEDRVKKQCLEAKVLRVKVFPFTRVLDEISISSHLFVFHYGRLKL